MKRYVAKTFVARLERIDSPLKWVIIRIPFDAAKIWGERGQLKVKGEINGFAFRTSLFPTGNGGHMMLVNKRMQHGAKTRIGMAAQLRLEPDTEKRIVTTPAELRRALRRWFNTLNYSTQNEICKWIAQAKGAEVRTRRAGQIAERLLATMEAERELPPIVQIAFARNPQAREGWERMSASHRRRHLLGIFYYRTPDARARRVARMIEEAAAFAERGASKRIRSRRPS
jgi:uncharacterized protein YdeI (YjbR/CyaY-like superfamily)